MNNKWIIGTLTIVALFSATTGFAKKPKAKLNTKAVNVAKKNDIKNQYCRLSTAFLEDDFGYILSPSLSYGYRVMNQNSGVDISVQYAGRGSKNRHAYFFSAPTLLYLRKLTFNTHTSRFYYGVGGSLSGQYAENSSHTNAFNEHGEPQYNKFKQEFYGLYANGALGYEIVQSHRVKVMGQLDCAYPMLSIYQKGEKIMHPTLTFGLGIGY